MNQKIPVTNTSAMPIYVAGQMIPAGETRHFDADQVPPHLRPAAPEPEEEAPVDPVAQILGHSVSAIKDMLPSLSDTELEALGAAEQLADKPRTTLLGAIAEEQLARAEKGTA